MHRSSKPPSLPRHGPPSEVELTTGDVLESSRSSLVGPPSGGARSESGAHRRATPISTLPAPPESTFPVVYVALSAVFAAIALVGFGLWLVIEVIL